LNLRSKIGLKYLEEFFEEKPAFFRQFSYACPKKVKNTVADVVEEASLVP